MVKPGRLKHVVRLLPDAHHPERPAPDFDGFPDRIGLPEEPAGHLLLEHGDFGAMELGLGEEASQRHGAALDVHVGVVGAQHEDALGSLVLILDPHHGLEPEARVPDVIGPSNCGGILLVHHGTNPHFVG